MNCYSNQGLQRLVSELTGLVTHLYLWCAGVTVTFYVNKIKQIREDLDSCPQDSPSFFKFDGPQLSMFEPVTEELICIRLISQPPTKSCTLDPHPHYSD